MRRLRVDQRRRRRAHDGAQSRHDGQRRPRAEEHDRARVPHGQERGDEECLVTDFREDDHGRRLGEALEEFLRRARAEEGAHRSIHRATRRDATRSFARARRGRRRGMARERANRPQKAAHATRGAEDDDGGAEESRVDA